MAKCIKCWDTGITATGEPCDCGAGSSKSDLPIIWDIPEQYQSCYFDVSFLPKWLDGSYGSVLQSVISEIKSSYSYSRNLLICAPPNSGKSVFAYTVYRIFAENELPVSDVFDLNEVRKLMADIYPKDNKYELLINVKVAVVKIPMDLPQKFVETMCTLVDLRLRHNGKTIFLYDGSKEDLLAQDRFSRLEDVLGDGSYHSIACYSYIRNKERD